MPYVTVAFSYTATTSHHIEHLPGLRDLRRVRIAERPKAPQSPGTVISLACSIISALRPAFISSIDIDCSVRNRPRRAARPHLLRTLDYLLLPHLVGALPRRNGFGDAHQVAAPMIAATATPRRSPR